MKKRFSIVVFAVIFCMGLMGCREENKVQAEPCGHEEYLELIEYLEKDDYAAARQIIDAMENVVSAATETAEQTEATEATQQPQQTEAPEGETVELDIRNFQDYFEIREDLIFENPVKCYQSIQLREEYRDAEVRNVNVEVSFFDAYAYGELDHKDQLFFPEHYNMVTGDLELKEVAIGSNGEGFLSLGSYSNGCFRDYWMDIAVTEVTGTLILKEN